MPIYTFLGKWLKRLLRVFLVLLLLFVVFAIACIAFVEIQSHRTVALLAPTGPYSVGRIEYNWIDQSRDDSLAPHAGMKRDLVVWAWYPATRKPGAQSAPYWPSKWGEEADKQHSLMGLKLIQSYDSIQTNSFDHAPIATDAAHYPVLIFEPGMGNLPLQYTALLEDIASHGYIVFAIAPTYSANVVVFPDGRVAEATTAGKINDDMDLRTQGNRLISVWSRDVIFSIDQLERLNTTPEDMFNGHLDLARLGVFGHSFGGATAAQVCHMDTRCKAGIDLDGDLFGDVVQTGLNKPFMVIQHDINTCTDPDCQSFQRELQAVLYTVPKGKSYNLSVKNTEHFNFSDYAAYFSPLRALGALGSIDGVRGLQITRAYIHAFFDTYLNSSSSPLLRGPTNAYPEVQFLTSS